MGYHRYPRSETENVSLHHELVHSVSPCCAPEIGIWHSLPSDGSWTFQATSYPLSEWKYLNAC